MKARIVSLMLVLLVTGGAAAQAQEAAQPQLNVIAQSFLADGTQRSSVGSPHPMQTGAAVTSYIFAGNMARGGGLCSLGGAEDGIRPLETLVRENAHVWRISRTGVAYRDGKLTFDLDWSRYANDSGARQIAGGKQRITLAEGGKLTLDMARADPASSCEVGSVVIELAAGAIENPEFADVVLQYDVWLVHRAADGSKQTHHVTTSARHGAQAGFGFAPIRFGLPKLAPGQYDLDAVTRIAGALRGRMGKDGKVAVELDTRRINRIERDGDAPAADRGPGGQKLLTLALGEPVEIQLPASNGYSAYIASSADAARQKGVQSGIGVGAGGGGSAPTEPVLYKDGRIIVNFGPFFAKDQFSLIVQVKKVVNP